MTRREATELARFINGYNARYQAAPLAFGQDKAWVVLSHRETGGNPFPITDPAAYLRQLDAGHPEPGARGRTEWELLPEGREILRAYLTRNDHDPAKLEELNAPNDPAGLE